MAVCIGCGEKNPARARYCLACGHQLPSTPQRQTRKVVTIVFCDLVGSTSLTEALDPEAVRAVVSRYFSQMRGALERHGATVEKFIGDAIMAVFGIPDVREDDALRAVRAAWEMRSTLNELNHQLRIDAGVTLQARTGIATGEVVAGEPSEGQGFASGDAVNTAARLEQVAPPGEVVISQPTYELVRAAVRVERLEPQALKGKREPVTAYVVADVTPAVAGVARRLDTPLVGRRTELAALNAVFDATRSASSCRMATVVGAAGVGKSRLVDEFLSAISAAATVLKGRCLPYGEGITFWPVTEVLRHAAAITENDPAAAATRKLDALLPQPLDDRSTILTRLEALLGVEEVSGIIQETYWAVRRVFELLAISKPLVVVFEDIHWGEAAFLDFLDYMMGFSKESSILLLCIARPELLEDRSGWGSEHETATLLRLDPLDPRETDALVSALVGGSNIPSAVTARIEETAQGNPLFVEELLRMLVDRDILRRHDRGWELTRELDEIDVPPTIEALLAARLDRLEPAEREVVERGAIVGETFSWSAIANLAPRERKDRIASYLHRLIARELLRPDLSAFSGEDAFRFTHILLRDAAYRATPKQLRAELHERFAAWLEQSAQDLLELDELVGYHLEQSYRYLKEVAPLEASLDMLGRRAGERLAVAGKRALLGGDNGAAVNLLSRAIDLFSSDERERLSTLLPLAEALRENGELASEDQVLRELAAKAAALGEPRLEAHAAIGRAEIAALYGSHPLPDRSELDWLVGVLEQSGDEAGLAKLFRLLATCESVLGQQAASLEMSLRAIEHARNSTNRKLYEECIVAARFAELHGATPITDGLNKLEKIEVEATIPTARAMLYCIRAVYEAMSGQFPAARLNLGKSQEMLDRFGLKLLAAWLPGFSGQVELIAGDAGAAERELNRAYEILGEIGDSGVRSTVAALVARALLLQGRYEEAHRFTEISEDLAADDDLLAQVQWRTGRAQAVSARRDHALAARIARDAVSLAETTDFLNEHATAIMCLGDVLCAAEKKDEAVTAYREARRLFKQKGNVVSAEAVSARLRALGQRSA